MLESNLSTVKRVGLKRKCMLKNFFITKNFTVTKNIKYMQINTVKKFQYQLNNLTRRSLKTIYCFNNLKH